MSELIFQPYGVIPGGYKAKGQDREIVMEAWQPGLPQQQRLASFNDWQQERLDEFAATLWPRFDFGKREWVGQAKSFAEGLTKFEIDVMIDAFMGSTHILTTTPSSPLAVNDIESHLKHYNYEDQSPNPPGFGYQQYDRTLTIVEEKTLLKTMLEAISAGNSIGKKCAGHFWFKFNMQRPRPLHAAMVFECESDFVSELSQRGQHPSFVSGHCFQGTMMACAVLENWIKTNPNLTKDRIDSLAQYMVDFGDRRVFAGVHYPTDNVASWVLAISLIPEVFEEAQPILNFVRTAVTRRSTVFKTIRDRYSQSNMQENTGAVISLLEKYGLSV